mmetsp:Transcript_33380/g.59806  ORF Transcript_33380/g.59806 Transcript_33380/m.59806 type:complete len:96 (+) Transcript_33380:1200-1487(+)
MTEMVPQKSVAAWSRTGKHFHKLTQSQAGNPPLRLKRTQIISSHQKRPKEEESNETNALKASCNLVKVNQTQYRSLPGKALHGCGFTELDANQVC